MRDSHYANPSPPASPRAEVACFNCGFFVEAERAVLAKVKTRAKNAFERDSDRTHSFCCETCAIQAAFLELPTRTITSISREDGRPVETIVRLMGASAISYAEFRSLVRAGSLDFSLRKPARRGGRPRRWASEAERLRAFRATKRGVKSPGIDGPERPKNSTPKPGKRTETPAHVLAHTNETVDAVARLERAQMACSLVRGAKSDLDAEVDAGTEPAVVMTTTITDRTTSK